MREEALNYHNNNGKPGKIGTKILTSVKGKEDLALAYTPGVAIPCLEIAKDKNKVYNYTSKGNSVAVISNGTAVLGLGNIGAAAGKPVMEGKALLFKHFAGIDAVDVEIDSEDVNEIVRTVELISGTYGGINLEDFKAPECFDIEEKLKAKLDIPVFHDDQHGTAVVVGAGLTNALKIIDKKFDKIKVVINGAGSAGIAIGKMLLNLGVEKNNLFMCDSKGLIVIGNDYDVSKIIFARDENSKNLEEVIKAADVFIGVSAADVFLPDMLKSMNENPIVFAMANPNPEISWDLAKVTRDDVLMATGRSDFPNQVNNVLAFPGIFRGALDCRASEINEKMKVAAVGALAGLIKEPTKDGFIVDAFNERIVIEIAVAVAEAAIKSGVCNEKFDLISYKVKLEKEFLKD
jgi:malate dehydrogenase (oxaloacetate-decarboxylating)(NADP+)